MTPRGTCEGGECSLQTAGSASRAACTWHVKRERRGCMRSGLRERERMYWGEAQPAAKAQQNKLSLSAENRVKKKKKEEEMWFWYLLLHPC